MANATKANDRQGQESSPNKEHAQQGAQAAMGAVSGAVDTVKEAASSAMNWASDMAGNAKNYASTAAGAVGDLGSNIGSHASEYAHDAKEYAGVAYDKAGELGRDFSNLVRRNPIPTVLAAVGVGFLLGRTLRS
ncbi:MAG: hypothetical protein K2X38_06890 [Gemmataceae bacterium]|nr:hypothetical protein [Gemmataceae bacterium]